MSFAPDIISIINENNNIIWHLEPIWTILKVSVFVGRSLIAHHYTAGLTNAHFPKIILHKIHFYC